EFVGTAQSLAGGSGWVLLTYSRRQKRFWNQIATDHTQAAVDAAPVLVLDMYEHAYQMAFGVNATAYIDTFFRNINWEAVLKRIEAARNDQPLPNEDPSSTKDMPSVSVEELAAQIANGSGVQIVDARQRDHMSRNVTKTLIERGFDARFVRGGIAAWYASGGARALRPTAG